MDAPSIGPPSGSGSSMDNVVGVTVEPTDSQNDQTRALDAAEELTAQGADHVEPFCREALRRLPVIRAVPPIHPLRRFLLERGVSLSAGARYLGVSSTTLRAWISWRSRPPLLTGRTIEHALGVASGTFFTPLY